MGVSSVCGGFGGNERTPARLAAREGELVYLWRRVCCWVVVAHAFVR